MSAEDITAESLARRRSVLAGAFEAEQQKEKKKKRHTPAEKSPALTTPRPREKTDLRRHRWTSKAMMVLLIISLITSLVLAYGLKIVWENRIMDVMMVTFDPNRQQIVSILPFDQSFHAMETLRQLMIERYVKERETILPQQAAMASKWANFLAQYSSESVYRDFQREKTTLYADLYKQSELQEVTIESLRRSQTNTNQYELDFITERYDSNRNLLKKERQRAIVEMRINPEKVSYMPARFNPMGFEVTLFTAVKRVEKEDNTPIERTNPNRPRR